MPSASFDVIGTCFAFTAPITTLSTLLSSTLDNNSISADALFFTWFYAAQRDFTYLSMSGSYTPIATVLRTTFLRACLTVGIPADAVPDDAVEKIMHAFVNMGPRPGLGECFKKLGNAGWDVLAVTNGGLKTSAEYFRKAGIEIDERCVLSCDDLQAAKPDVRVYENARKCLTERAGTRGEEGERWFVAAHAWDLVAARKAGFKTAYLDYEEHDPVTEIFGEFDIRASSMSELAEKMLEHGA